MRTGVLLTQLAGLATLVHLVLAPTGGRLEPLPVALAAGVAVSSPLLLVLPRRGAARVDGGAESPLSTLLFLTLAFTAVAQPPTGVALTGAMMTASHLLVVGEVDPRSLSVAAVMAIFTTCCAVSSANALGRPGPPGPAAADPGGAGNHRPADRRAQPPAFLERPERAVGLAGRGQRAVVRIVDLDGSEAVDDLEGHAAGDAVLRAGAEALTAAVRETDTVARLGGDEFAVLADSAVPADDAALADRLRAAVAGVLHRADEAMHRAEAAGGDRVHDLAR
ncbi:diguanylate cyclase [Geodermatophilus maliterrae]|uniref:Diguanylate cyclase n=1 Tax=Geodermatophilus maliterrae TaxID=3162531 RepID=A0ABV3XPX5_9ACTN